MLTRLALMMVCALALSACEAAQEARETTQEAARTTIAQIDQAKVLSDLNTAKTALAAYQVENQKFPAALAELKIQLNYPDELAYDATTGQVRSKTFPNMK